MHQLVGYLGLPGSWTHQTACELFGDRSELVGMDATDLLKAYAQGDVPRICIPYYSSIAGPTPYLAQLLSLPGLWIEQDVVRPVQHSLAACDPDILLNEVTHLTGHPVALEEVRTWLQREIPQAQWEMAGSGSEAARTVSRLAQRSHLAVAPPHALAAHGLHTVVQDIPTDAPNITRWWVIGPEVPQTPSPGRWVWLKVAGSSQQALCTLERALSTKAIEPALWVHTTSVHPQNTQWLVACLRSDDLYAFLVLVSLHGLTGTLMGAHDDAISHLVTSHEASTSACAALNNGS